MVGMDRPAIVSVLDQLGERIEEPSEETFLLFSQIKNDSDLGMLDPKAREVEVSIGSRDLTIRQAPGLLTSPRDEGTTGAALWSITVRLAQWLSAPANPLFEHGLIGLNSSIVELGAGIAGLLPHTLHPRVASYLATDQKYVLKLLDENIRTNLSSTRRSDKEGSVTNIVTAPLDWETDDIQYFLRSHGLAHGADVVIASDCVYNYHLIKPLTQAMREISQARGLSDVPTICLIAQQLRQPDVFEQWISDFSEAFQTWRLTDDALGKHLDSASGYAVHLGMLKDQR